MHFRQFILFSIFPEICYFRKVAFYGYNFLFSIGVCFEKNSIASVFFPFFDDMERSRGIR